MIAKIEINLPTDFLLGKVTQKRIRISVGQAIANRIRHRVQKRGEGASGKLKGYSTNPRKMSISNQGRLKPIVKPKARIMRKSEGSKAVSRAQRVAFFKGGYKQYREDVGLGSEKFILSNKGELWRDWKAGMDSPTGRVKVGFSRAANMIASDLAQNDGRGDMFEPGWHEIDAALEGVQEVIEKALLEAIKRGRKTL